MAGIKCGACSLINSPSDSFCERCGAQLGGAAHVTVHLRPSTGDSLFRIHRWDTGAVIKAVVIGSVAEAIAIAPAVLSPWDHAGPETMLGWLSILVNLPGIFLTDFLRSGPGDFFYTPVYLVQTAILSYVAFVCIRLMKGRVKFK